MRIAYVSFAAVMAAAVFPVAFYLGQPAGRAPLSITVQPETPLPPPASAETKEEAFAVTEPVPAVTPTQPAPQAQPADSGTPAAENPVAATTAPVAGEPEPVAVIGDFIDRFDLISPKAESLCDTNSPWLLGERAIDEQTPLRQQDCFAVRVQLKTDATVYVYIHSQDGSLVRLLPNGCEAMGPVDQRLAGGKSLHLPQTGGGDRGILGMGDPGRESIYVIALSTTESEALFQDLVRDVPDVCRQNADFKLDESQLKALLEKAQRQLQGDFQWLSRTFTHG